MQVEREDWEGEVFDNLERMCAEHPHAAAETQNPPEENPPRASQGELAKGFAQLPAWLDRDEDDDAWCPRMA